MERLARTFAGELGAGRYRSVVRKDRDALLRAETDFLQPAPNSAQLTWRNAFASR